MRTSFYRDRGLDATLTHFPPVAFNQAVTLAGLRHQSSAIDRAVTTDTEEDRSQRAYGLLLKLERALRVFICKSMAVEFGDEWMRSQVPPDKLAAWIDRKSKAIESGMEARPLIEYADFTDYLAIIVRKDNWRRVFEIVFKRQENVRESLQRIYPLRVATAHSRFISQDDELYLLAESRRLLRAIGG